MYHLSSAGKAQDAFAQVLSAIAIHVAEAPLASRRLREPFYHCHRWAVRFRNVLSSAPWANLAGCSWGGTPKYCALSCAHSLLCHKKQVGGGPKSVSIRANRGSALVLTPIQDKVSARNKRAMLAVSHLRREIRDWGYAYLLSLRTISFGLLSMLPGFPTSPPKSLTRSNIPIG